MRLRHEGIGVIIQYCMEILISTFRFLGRGSPWFAVRASADRRPPRCLSTELHQETPQFTGLVQNLEDEPVVTASDTALPSTTSRFFFLLIVSVCVECAVCQLNSPVSLVTTIPPLG
jgi:hypothetical protein